jgi:hypothetical protein
VKKDLDGGFDGVPKAENGVLCVVDDLCGELNTECLQEKATTHVVVSSLSSQPVQSPLCHEKHKQFSDLFLATCANGLVRSTGPEFWYSHSMGASKVRRSMAQSCSFA